MLNTLTMPAKRKPHWQSARRALVWFAIPVVGLHTAVAGQPAGKGEVAGQCAISAASDGSETAIQLTVIEPGDGPCPQDGEIAILQYRGVLADTGEMFDESNAMLPPFSKAYPEGIPFPVQPGRTIDGFYQGLRQMRIGGLYRLFIPSYLAYGAQPPPGAPIPPNADLFFWVRMVDVNSQEEFERKMANAAEAVVVPSDTAPGSAPAPAPSPR